MMDLKVGYPSPTVFSPQAPGQYHIYYQVMGIQQGKERFFSTEDYIKNLWMDVRVWQTYLSLYWERKH